MDELRRIDEGRAGLGALFVLSAALLIWLVAGPTNERTLLLGGTTIGTMILVLARHIDDASGIRPRALTMAAACNIIAMAALALIDDQLARLGATTVLLLVGFGAPISIVARLGRRRRLDLTLLFGAATVYLLLGIAFAMAYSIVAHTQSTDLLSTANTTTDGSLRDRVYFSYVTLSTTGYGDFAPASGTARALAIMESLGGQLYLVIAMSSIVSVLIQARAAARSAATGS